MKPRPVLPATVSPAATGMNAPPASCRGHKTAVSSPFASATGTKRRLPSCRGRQTRLNRPIRIARWTVPDPMAEKYYGVNAYSYCAGDPVNRVDSEGKKIIFVHGLAKAGAKPGRAYWNNRFVDRALSTLKDNHKDIESYQYDILSTAKQRRKRGYKYAKENFDRLSLDMEENEPFRFVTHSMGAAFAEGMAEYLVESGFKVDILIHLSPFQAGDIKTQGAKDEILTIDLQTIGDPVLYFGGFSQGEIVGADYSIKKERQHPAKQFMYIHTETLNPSTWDEIIPIINDFLNHKQ